MNTDLKALAKAATILRTLADADAKMPVLHGAGLDRFLDACDDVPPPLVRLSDAQAAILAATERAEKAEALLREARHQALTMDGLKRENIGPQHWVTAIDQHLGAAK
jgi:hypothetical protein